MLGKAPDSILRAGALGTMVNAGVYGRAIPLIYGTTRSPILPIWAANLRRASGSGKKPWTKNNAQAYAENIDVLIGHNPLIYPLQAWDNANNFYSLLVEKYTAAPSGGSVTIPTSDFYAVLAVTITINYDSIFDDYGGPGFEELTGSFDVPLWNAAFNGPDPCSTAAYLWYPYVYKWLPGAGPVVKVPYLTDAVNIYYVKGDPNVAKLARRNGLTGSETPISVLNLEWETLLGQGNEYALAGLAAQQIIYPWFAGVMSPNIDLGASGAIPNVNLEMLGSFALYPDPTLVTVGGDADFADMITDIFTSGPAQGGYDSATQAGGPLGLTAVQHGLNCSDFPGVVQKKTWASVDNSSHPTAIAWDAQVTKGDFLVVLYRNESAGSSPTGISDTLLSAWTNFVSRHPVSGANVYGWYAQAASTGANAVTIIGGGSDNQQLDLYEIAGFDTLEQVAVADGASGPLAVSISSTTPRTQPGLLLALWAMGQSRYTQAPTPRWQLVSGTSVNPMLQTRSYSYGSFAESTKVWGATTKTAAHTATSDWWVGAALAFKNTNPPGYPISLGNILEPKTLANATLGARAGGLWGSLNINAGRKASDILSDLYASMNAAPVWTGSKLKSIAWSEVSAAANGAIFIAPTANGPVANLGPSDFIGDDKTPPLQAERQAQIDAPPILSMQIIDRANNYNQNLITRPDPAGAALFGVRKASPMKRDEIQDPVVAQTLLGIASRRQTYVRNSYKGKVNMCSVLLEPMDLVTLYEPQIGLGSPAVVPGSVTLQEKTLDLTIDGAITSLVTSGGDAGALGYASGPIGSDPCGVYIYTIYLVNDVETITVTTASGAQTMRLEAVQGNTLVVSQGFSTKGGQGLKVFELPGIWPTLSGFGSTASQGSGGDIGLLTHGPAFVASAWMVDIVGRGDCFKFQSPTLSVNQDGASDTFEGSPVLGATGRYYSAGVTARSISHWVPTVDPVCGTIQDMGASGVIFGYSPPVGFNPPVPSAAPFGPAAAFRVRSVDIAPDYALDMSFEPFAYGLNAPQIPTVTSNGPNGPIFGADPGSVNAPVFIEAVPPLTLSPNTEQLLIALSGADPNYGGCAVYISDDGGASYEVVGSPLQGSAITGVTVGDWPAHADPDTTNNLTVDLSESNGELGSYTAQQRDSFGTLFYVAGGTSDIPYEIGAYNDAALTGTDKYTIFATGSGNEIRRSVFGAPTAGAGVDHPNGSRFAFLGNPATGLGPGIIAIPIKPSWIGVALKFKFQAFNQYDSAAEGISGLTVYTFTPTGKPGQLNPSGIPPQVFTVNGT